MASNIFGTGVSGLAAVRSALATTSHNIANVDTPGFSRQRVELGTRPSQPRGDGFIGTGVGVTTVRRLFDQFAIDQIRGTVATVGEFDRLHDLSRRVDNLLADPSTGLGPSLQEFFGAMQGLADDPSSIASRQVLLGDAGTLVGRFHALDGELQDMGRGVNRELADIVTEINTFTAQVGDLNKKIALLEAQAAGQPANDLRDRRDEVVREISRRIEVNAFEQDDGAINLTIGGGQALVVGATVANLSIVGNPFDPTRSEVAYTVSGTTAIVSHLISGGEVRGVLDFREQVLDAGRDALGRVALGLASTVNTQHRLGMDLDGNLGGDFFQSLAGSSPSVLSNVNNTGAPPAVLSAAVTDVSVVSASEYRLERTGATHTLTRLDDGVVFTLATFPTGPETVDGITLDLTSGAIADGDSFVIQPTRNAARDIATSISTTREIAAAAPVRTRASLGNSGTGSVTAGVVNSPDNNVSLTFTGAATFDVVDNTTGATLATGLSYTSGAPISFNGWTIDITGAPAVGDTFTVDHAVTSAAAGNTGGGVVSVATIASPDPNLGDPVTITFGTPPNTFNVTGATTGSPTVNVAYTSGTPVSYNGWTVTIVGTPAAGDVFTVEPNNGGVGDNRNMLALAQLQTSDTLDQRGATFGEAFGQLVAEVGTTTQGAQANLTAQNILLEQAIESRDTVSGVNLDEEAADLLRLQQAFEANARVISVANEIFDSLLNAVS